MNKKAQIIPLLLLFIFCHGWAIASYAKKDSLLFIIGPSISKHYATHYTGFNKFHPGFGGEFQLSLNKWVLGVQAYYMIKDSLDHKAYWTGITAGYRFGSKRGLWCTPFFIIGGIKKKRISLREIRTLCPAGIGSRV
jgi:hypothetical protein